MSASSPHPGTVAIVNRSMHGTGTVAKSIEIATALHEAGIPVEIWAARPDGVLAGRVPAGVPLIDLGRGRRLRGAGREMLALGRTLRERKPALLLSAGKHFHLVARGGLLLSRRRSSTVFGGRASNSGVRPGRGPIRNAIANMLYRPKYRGMDFIVAVSSDIEREVAGKLGPHAPPIHCIPNGVDLSPAWASRMPARSHRWIDDPALRVLVSAGRLDPQKGYDVLLRALAELRDVSDLRLLIAGDGGPDTRKTLERLAEGLGVADRIDFLGYLADPFALIGKGDLFVLPSRWEGASNALLEAMACGLPIVATDCPGGSREILGGGAHGRLTPVDDPRALAAAIRAELAERRDPAIQRAAARRFDLTSCMDEYVSLLDRYRRHGAVSSVGQPLSAPQYRPRFG
ncbi:glycosyltransferase [Sphingomonas sp. ID0503]|uniref:glycosyltransferase n=1 Tax=Sphingomonas sp. ID0503 TaxID=3399691 RepID=UPI003AFA9010